MSALKHLLACALMLGLSTVAVSGRAQAGGGEASRADALLREAIALADANDWAGAGERLEEAWALKKSYDVAGNLGQVYEKLDRMPEAAKYYDYAVRTFPPSGKPELKQTLVERFQAVKAKVGTVTVTVSEARAKLVLAGKEVGESPLSSPLYVAPGSQELQVQKKGFATDVRTIIVAAGGELTLDVALRKDPAQPSDGEAKPLWPAILMGAVGAAGIGAGIGLIVVSRQRVGDAEVLRDTCVPLTEACAAGGDDLLSEANGLQGGGIAALAVGGAAAIGMAVYLAVPSGDAEAPPKPTAQLTPILGPGLAGLSFATSF